jgi:hypothetical protein
MAKDFSETKEIIFRLTYLWAFAEGGLGGFMHLLHIPMTGFIVGGIAIIINVFLAAYSKVNYRIMLSSLGLVLLCKFALSPQSPLGAYVAVSFQGLLAIGIFKLGGVNRLSILFYAILVMLENAIQKPLMAYIIFGDELLKGIELVVNKFFKNLDYTKGFLSAMTFLYFVIYAAWGMIMARWSYQFLHSIETYTIDTRTFISIEKSNEHPTKSYRKSILSIVLLSAILFFVFFYFSSHKISWSAYLLKATTWFILLGFILPIILRLALKQFSKTESSSIARAISFMPKIKQNFFQSLELVRDKKGLIKIKQFIFFIIFLNVFHTDDGI